MNPINHIEIPAKDFERSKKFYTEIFNWKIEDVPGMDGYKMVYTTEVDENYMPKTPGAVNGGMLSVKDNGGLNPVLTITVPSVDEYLEKIVRAGGEIVMEKTEVMDMGYSARFKDTEGVVMGLWEMKNKDQ